MGLFNFIYRSLRSSSLEECLHGEDTWALVTGGSDGIGRGFVEELLARGFNVFVHGRTEAKLLALQEELAAQFPARKIEHLCFDAGSADVEGTIAAMVAQIGDRRITVLVNNVGYQSHWTPFVLQAPSEAQTIIRVQSDCPTLLTHALLPALGRSAPAAIVNVGGLTSEYPALLLAVHSGAKAYFIAFTEALALEMKYFDVWRPQEKTKWAAVLSGESGEGAGETSTPKVEPPRIYVHAINVHNVATSSNLSSPSFFIPTPRRMAKAALDVVGCGEVFVTAYWRHALMGALLQVLPRGVVQSAMAKEISRLRKLEDGRQGANGTHS